MNICVVGTGYVGLVTGICFAEVGNHVICVDIDETKINKLSSGEVTIFEPNLDKMLVKNLEYGRVQFTTDLKRSVHASDIIFLALPTPSDEDGSADLSYILGVAKELGSIISNYKVIVNKSTVPVGTAAKVRAVISQTSTVEFDVVSNPEFLREGAAVEDFLKPDRVVIGTSSEKAKQMMAELYAPFVRQGNPIIFMDEASSELTKYAANAFLATKISFMNEIANLCELTGANVDMVRLGIGSDDRIGKRFLFAGIGYGGSCFPKDVEALKKTSDDVGYEFKILNSVRSVNTRQRELMLNKILEYYHGDVRGKKIALWGLAFKPNTDDIREAPALYLIEKLVALGAEISAFDPEAADNVKRKIGNIISYCHDPYQALSGADCLVIATEWPVFRTPDFESISQSLKEQVIFDGRNLYSIDKMKSLGFQYFSIGRPMITKN